MIGMCTQNKARDGVQLYVQNPLIVWLACVQASNEPPAGEKQNYSIDFPTTGATSPLRQRSGGWQTKPTT